MNTVTMYKSICICDSEIIIIILVFIMYYYFSINSYKILREYYLEVSQSKRFEKKHK